MFGFDKMFDFNRDGKLDSWERAAQFQFMDEMMKDDEKSILDDDDEIDTFADARRSCVYFFNIRNTVAPEYK